MQTEEVSQRAQSQVWTELALPSLASPAKTRALLDEYGLSTKYSLGQNFLVNDGILKKISQLAELSPEDCVLEVGPGIGTLTRELLAHVQTVISVEYDSDLIPVLQNTLAPYGERFRLLPMDALDLRPEHLQELGLSPQKLVANLPYAVAATVLLQLFQQMDSLQSATVMVQKEVADRMKAVPGSKNYGAYTVKLGLFSQVQGSFPVSPGSFFPPPRVESAVIRLDRRLLFDEQGEPCSRELIEAACIMAEAAFATRRKTISNSCRSYFAGRGELLDALPRMLQEAGIDARRRGETLDLQEYLRLGKAFLAVQA